LEVDSAVFCTLKIRILQFLMASWTFLDRYVKTAKYSYSVADFCASVLQKALKINLLYPKKEQTVKISEVQKCKSPIESFQRVSTLLSFEFVT